MTKHRKKLWIVNCLCYLSDVHQMHPVMQRIWRLEVSVFTVYSLSNNELTVLSGHQQHWSVLQKHIEKQQFLLL